MGDNGPRGDGVERNEGLEIKSRPPESHPKEQGKGHRTGGGIKEKQISCRKRGEKTFRGDISFPVNIWSCY